MALAPRNLAVLASGKGSDLQSLLDAHSAGRISSRVSAVLSDRPEAQALARGSAAGASTHAVRLDRALRRQDRRADHDARMAERIDELDPDLLVLAGYMRVLSPGFVRRYEGRIINIHPALLPSFPGTRGVAQALKRGVRIAGCTTHFVDEQVDHGPIILQAAVPVHPDDTEDSLARRVLRLEHQILPRTIHLWEQDRLLVDDQLVSIDADQSWTERYPTVEGAVYGPGY